jgi:hypothetical protein
LRAFKRAKRWWNGLLKRAAAVCPLGVDARVLMDPMRRAV